MVGLPVDKSTLDQRAGSLAWQLRSTFEQIAILKAWLDGQQDADLVGLGYSSGDVAVLKSAFADLASLSQVAHGQASQAQAKDFFAFAGRLTGVQ